MWTIYFCSWRKVQALCSDFSEWNNGKAVGSAGRPAPSLPPGPFAKNGSLGILGTSVPVPSSSIACEDEEWVKFQGVERY